MTPDAERPPMPLAEALAILRRVAAQVPCRGQACACCGGRLPDGAAEDYGALCGACVAAHCEPFLGRARHADPPDAGRGEVC